MARKDEVWFASDYAGAQFGNYDFYYGYEHTICPTHGNDSRECDCDEKQWAFVAKHDGIEFDRFAIGDEQWCEPDEALAYGLALLFSKYGNPMKIST